MPAEDTDNKIVAEDEESGREKEAPDTTDQNTVTAKTEIGGRDGPDPTRYGDWEKAGRCIDF